MRVNAATVGAVTLGSSVMAQSTPAAIQPMGTTDLKSLQALGEWTLDACHKIDSEYKGFIWPCASQLKTAVNDCPTSAGTDEERVAQRDCLCAEPSSWLQDAVACSECKVQNGLQPDNQRDYWVKFYKAVDERYCQAKEVTQDFESFRVQLSNEMPIPEGGKNVNSLVGKVIDPKSYYGSNVPKKQGAGKAVAKSGDNSNKEATKAPAVDPLAGQVKVPVYVAIADMPTAADNKTTETIKPTTAAPFQNGTATVRPSTFLTVTTSTSTGSPITTLLPSSSVVPAPGTVPGPVEERIIVIAGKPCVVYIVWIIVDCTPKTDNNGNFAIDYKTVGVDKKKPVLQLDNKEQFDKIKDNMPNLAKNNDKLVEDVKKHVGTTAPAVETPEQKTKDLPPVKVSSGVQPTDEEQECEPVTDDSDASVPVGSTNPGQTVPVGKPGQTVPVGKPGQTVPVGKPGQTGPSNKQGSESTVPSNKGSESTVPSNKGSESTVPSNKQDSVPSAPNKTGQTPSGSNPSSSNPSSSNPSGSNPSGSTCECECPSTGGTSTAAASSSDRNAAEICDKKVETEKFCQSQPENKIKQCLCSEGEFANQFFFDQAITCARRTGDVRQSEFEAQILFETKYRFCMTENSFGSDVFAAYQSVEQPWRDARQPFNSKLI